MARADSPGSCADLIWINVEPAFASLRDQPSFQAIIDEMNFPRAISTIKWYVSPVDSGNEH